MAYTSKNRQSRLDVLGLPLLGRFLLWKHSRTFFQAILFGVAVIMIIDGWFGSRLAAKNTATVAAWVHYRGLIIVALLLFGNLFCAACPFLLPRNLARWFGRPTRRWPKVLRNKWLAGGALLGMLFVYELFDLWASPWLTAWVIVAYFGAAFVLEALFTRDSFCLYVCPLGTFNFLYSTISPFQITNRELDTCRTCVGHDCINGQRDHQGALVQQGCQLELYVPTIQSNLNCTFCLDCAKACPHDNVALAARPYGRELFRQSWPNRLDISLLATIAAFAGMMNAFAMTPPVYGLETWLGSLLQTRVEGVVLGLIFVSMVLIVPLLLVYGAAWLNQRMVAANRQKVGLHHLIKRYAYGFVPLGFGIWAAHYLFHLLVGPMTIVPAVQQFFAATIALPIFGQADWQLAGLLAPSLAGVQTVQMIAVAAGTAGALAVSWQAARRAHAVRGQVWLELLPWFVIIVGMAVVSTYIFLLPMEMRGNVLG